MAIIPGQYNQSINIDTPQAQKNRRSLYSVILLLVLTAGVLYFGFFKGSGGAPEFGALPGGMSNAESLTAAGSLDQLLESLAQTELDASIFEDEKFKNLRASDKLPITAGEKGRDNPFETF